MNKKDVYMPNVLPTAEQIFGYKVGANRGLTPDQQTQMVEVIIDGIKARRAIRDQPDSPVGAHVRYLCSIMSGTTWVGDSFDEPAQRLYLDRIYAEGLIADDG